MGICYTKPKPKQVNVEELFSATKVNNTNPRDKPEFYYFVQWILSFDFYRKLQNIHDIASELTIKEDPKDSTIFKIIKAIDSLTEKEKFTVFSLYRDKKNKKENKLNVNPNAERETLNYLFFLLAKNDVTKLRNILINGPPNNIRWLIWISIAKIGYDTIQSQLNLTNETIYQSMLNKQLIDTIKGTILKDVSRTNSYQFFKNNFNWQSSLTNVLKAIASYDNKLGYCFGMNSIAANSLLVSDFNEGETFFLLRYLYSIEYGLKLRQFFIEGFPRINYYSFIINHLTETRLPLIYEVIKTIELDKTMWIDKWLQTLFGFLKLSLSVRLWDCLIALGLNFVIKFSLGCLKYCEADIIHNAQISNENFNAMLTEKIGSEMVIKHALSFRIGKETKMKYDQMFFGDLIRSGLGDEGEKKEGEDIVIIKEGEKEDKKEEELKCNDNKFESYLNSNGHRKEDYLQRLKIAKIRAIYHQTFKKDEEEPKGKHGQPFIANDLKESAIKQMKQIYFGDLTEEDELREETKVLCSQSSLTYEQFNNRFEKDFNKTKPKKTSSTNLVSGRFIFCRRSSGKLSVKFRSPMKFSTQINSSQRNDSVIESKKESSSSYALSEDNEDFYSMSKGKFSDVCNSNHKSSLSLQRIDVKPIDENNDEEEEITILDGNIEPVLQENTPKKIAKLNGEIIK